MRLLALDTSSLACTVGVMVDNDIAIRHEEQPREHTKILMPMIRDTLAEADVKLRDLDAIVLGNGPGSFIGMRIAASVAQGLAFGSDLQIVPVSSMAAVAADAGQGGDIVAVAQDAHMREVYLGVYRIDADGLPQAAVAERLNPQAPIDELADYGAVIVAGFGWQRYPELLTANRSRVARVSDSLYPRAEQLLSLGAAAFAAGNALAPEAVTPAYLRQKVAEKPQPARQ